MPPPVLPSVHLWHDQEFRGPAANMAIDEALFDEALESQRPFLRFYSWNETAYTVGYFHDFEKDSLDDLDPPPVRRLTGGGLVEHGRDITFTLAIPGGLEVVQRTGPERYRAVHQCLVDAFEKVEVRLALESDDPQAEARCFARPVRWDVIDPVSGEKVAGGAQRRTRGGILHQGSVRPPPDHREVEAEWTYRFAYRLAFDVSPLFESDVFAIEDRADRLEREKYATAAWNRGG